MKKMEMKKICNPLGIIVGEKWLDSFLVKASSEETLMKLEPFGFKVVGIDIGYDYNSELVTMYARPN